MIAKYTSRITTVAIKNDFHIMVNYSSGHCFGIAPKFPFILFQDRKVSPNRSQSYKKLLHLHTMNQTNSPKSSFVLAATSSGCGKTTCTLGLLRGLRQKGYTVQPFKCGPDYIDTQHHAIAAGTPSINLDTFFSSPGHLVDCYQQIPSDNHTIQIIEGAMGLFDGYKRWKGSAADVAMTLDVPVILIVDAQSVAYSVAPLLYGYAHFNPQVRVAGVIFNKVASENHYNYLVDAASDAGVPCLGYIARSQSIAMPSRHLGLTLDDEFMLDEYANKAANLVMNHLDIDKLLAVTAAHPKTYPTRKPHLESQPNHTDPIRIAVAHDKAFNFIYPVNIKQLEKLGQITYFSPITDKVLPPCDLLYLPGGYPEFYLSELSTNNTMLTSIKTHAESGGKIWAECGGMMYLCASIIDQDGRHYPMVNIFPQQATMQDMKLRLGYRQFTCNNQNWRGHEFHYSRLINQDNMGPFTCITHQETATSRKVNAPIFRYKQVLASYTHLYWGEQNLLSLFKDLC